LVHVVVIWYIFPRLGILCQEKSGNPDYADFDICTYISNSRTFSMNVNFLQFSIFRCFRA
jgi:hypothetical protein